MCVCLFYLGVWIQVYICVFRLTYRPEEGIGFSAACVTDRSELALGLGTTAVLGEQQVLRCSWGLCEEGIFLLVITLVVVLPFVFPL